MRFAYTLLLVFLFIASCNAASTVAKNKNQPILLRNTGASITHRSVGDDNTHQIIAYKLSIKLGKKDTDIFKRWTEQGKDMDDLYKLWLRADKKPDVVYRIMGIQARILTKAST
ncbi:hypothetical protein GQ600_4776 [Phytophthora cactorum]|nr:hypothetical protein GQ600_4776 [Phytophthora cactorum]